ncbi:MAG: GrpB family protein, partial [Candidatus Tectomicrobia bacterium]|nr:GrpB family protein [Candidatus Tectomicrobia bacterium]
PILDIAVALASVAVIPQCIPRLYRIGYLDRGDGGANGGYLLVKESAPEVRTHHVHMVTIDDSQWRHYLRFRDRLRADEWLRAQYATLKQDLQHQFSQDRQLYTAAKHDFIRGVLRQQSHV